MGSDLCRVKLRLELNNALTTMVATFPLLLYVLLVGFVSDASLQRTYQRACDCEYMLNGKCAYTLLLPTGSNDGTCPGNGAGSEFIDDTLRNITNRVNKLYDVSVDQSMILTSVQESIIYLQRNYQPSVNGTSWPELPEKTLASFNATLQTIADEMDGLKKTTQMLAHNLSILTDLVELKLADLSNLSSVTNGTKQMPVNRTAADEIRDAKISQLSETVRLLRQASCIRRAPLFSGPDRLNGTNITVSSTYNNDTALYGPQHLAIDNTSAWCPSEPQKSEWVQFDIGRAVLVFAIATRGRQQYNQWITNYTVQYVPSDDSNGTASVVGALHWVDFKDIANENEVFQGNTDKSSIQLNMLWRPIFTRYVRILPLTGFNGGNVCTRADIIGCVDEI